MQDGAGLPTIAFLTLLVISVTRARHALAVPTSRLSWLASSVGAAALLAYGSVIPLAVLDGWLGGSNLVQLVRGVLAAVSFWLVLQAVLSQERPPSGRLRWWPLVVWVAAFSLAFLCIDRGPTATDFFAARADQVALLVYAGVHLAGVAAICTALVVKVSRGRSWHYGVLAAGAAMVATGSVAEIVFLVGQHLSWWSDDIRVVLGHAFYVLFHHGVVLVASSIGAFSLRRARRTRRLRASVHALETLMERHAVPAPVRRDRGDPENLSTYLYELVIAVHDHVHMGRIVLDGAEGDVVATAERTISTRLAHAARESDLLVG